MKQWMMLGVVGLVGLCGLADAGSRSCVFSASDEAKSPANERAERAFDGCAQTKWLRFGPQAWLQVELPEARRPVSYSLTSANDMDERDPKDWVLEGSDDGQNFFALDEQANQNFPTRFATRVFRIASPRICRFFRLNIKSNHGCSEPQKGPIIQLGEFDLLGADGKSLVSAVQAGGPVVLPDWAFGPFMRPEGVNPVIRPRPTSFFCPMRKRDLKWEESDTFNPAAAIKDGKIVVLYRAEDNTFQGIGSRTSRLGYAETTDGFTMSRATEPVLFPCEDDQKAFDWEGGCEDPRLAQTEDGLYICTYTSWNKRVPRLCVATSRDLKTWKKHGPAFAKFGGERFRNRACKSGAIVQAPSAKDPSRYVITKIDGKYVMYWGESALEIAYSDNLLDWVPAGPVMRTRRGYFDSALTEMGPAAILTKKGIVVFYNGKNSNGNSADPHYPRGVYSGGQALFSATEPTRLLARLDKPYFKPEAPFEKTGQYRDGTVFTEGLVFYKGQWHLYYGCADSFVGTAVWKVED